MGGRGKINKTFAALEELRVEEWLITEGSPRRPGQPTATALGPGGHRLRGCAPLSLMLPREDSS